MRSHLVSPLARNWSMMTCAPLAKSPNCASHSTSDGRVRQGVAVLEAQHALPRTASELKMSIFAWSSANVVQRHVLVGVGLVDQHRVALAEGAALAILARQAHHGCHPAAARRTPLPRRSPSRWPWPFSNAVSLGLELADDFGVGVEAVRHAAQRPCLWSRRPHWSAPWRLRTRSSSWSACFMPAPAALKPVRLVRLVALRRLVAVF